MNNPNGAATGQKITEPFQGQGEKSWPCRSARCHFPEGCPNHPPQKDLQTPLGLQGSQRQQKSCGRHRPPPSPLPSSTMRRAPHPIFFPICLRSRKARVQLLARSSVRTSVTSPNFEGKNSLVGSAGWVSGQNKGSFCRPRQLCPKRQARWLGVEMMGGRPEKSARSAPELPKKKRAQSRAEP